ncbi:hypothetical protein EDD85DRAFT_791976 [Armillaria nabsnona]|nr:hypothetical protein EDD85DRAFT_791976 [Armillaria nabsnona]
MTQIIFMFCHLKNGGIHHSGVAGLLKWNGAGQCWFLAGWAVAGRPLKDNAKALHHSRNPSTPVLIFMALGVGVLSCAFCGPSRAEMMTDIVSEGVLHTVLVTIKIGVVVMVVVGKCTVCVLGECQGKARWWSKQEKEAAQPFDRFADLRSRVIERAE